MNNIYFYVYNIKINVKNKNLNFYSQNNEYNT